VVEQLSAASRAKRVSFPGASLGTCVKVNVGQAVAVVPAKARTQEPGLDSCLHRNDVTWMLRQVHDAVSERTASLEGKRPTDAHLTSCVVLVRLRILCAQDWVPAFAGTTRAEYAGDEVRRSTEPHVTTSLLQLASVIPAKAGIQERL